MQLYGWELITIISIYIDIDHNNTMNRNEDLIELYHYGTEGNNEIRNYQNNTRPRSASLRARSQSISLQRENSGSFVPLNEDDSNASANGSIRFEQHTAEIIRSMEEDESLMEDNPISEHLRMEYLRDLPQNLTMKRSIKARVTKSVSKKSKHRPLGFWKRTKYHSSMTFNKCKSATKNLVYSFELWYSSLKAIEGHFGSGVATYFKFLRWIFVMNLLISIPTLIFLFIPQVIFDTVDAGANTDVVLLLDENNKSVDADRTIEKKSFSGADIITGEGYFTHTSMYYGHYINGSISLISGTDYNVPYAYFFTMLFSYITAFIVLSISMARSYRRSFIETSGGLKNIYAHKVFCGWDYSIATKEGAELKSAAIYNEIRELLSDENKVSRKMSAMFKFWTRTIQIVIHLFIILLLSGTGFLMWILLKKHRKFSDINENSDLGSASVITAIVVTIIMTIGPMIFSFIVKFEDYKNPRTILYISLLRTFLLEIVVIGVLIFFWLHNEPTAEQCWETSLGQEVYRLIFIDFIISVVLTALVEYLRVLIYKYLWPKIGISEFDIATNTLQIIYNQTLFWVGFYFSPLLSLVVTLKFWCTWYLKRLSCLHCCKPSTRSWRAAQTQTIFQVMTFLALFAVVIVYGYIFTRKPASRNCGPFQKYKFVYEMVFEGVLQIQEDHGFMKFLLYLTKPGVIMGLLIIMSLRVYYVRAKSIAQRGMVELLREMLVLEAKDKEFLLTNISKISEGTWMYMNNRDRYNNIYGRNTHQTYPSNTWQFRGDSKDNSLRRNNPQNPQNPSNTSRHHPEGSIRRNEQYSPRKYESNINNKNIYAPEEMNSGSESLYLTPISFNKNQNENRNNTFGRTHEQLSHPRNYDTDGEIIRRLPRYDSSRNSDGYNQNYLNRDSGGYQNQRSLSRK